MNNKKKLLSFILVLSVIVASSVLFINSQAHALEISINKMMNHVFDCMENDPVLRFSGNPYDFTKNNPYYDKIVERGIDIVPEIEEYMKSSGENGYREYILAIAIEEITKVNLKGDNYAWDRPSKFKIVFDNHVKSIPNKVKEISKSKMLKSEKNKEIEKLGTLAIPFIMDEIEGGSDDLSEGLVLLLEGSKKVDSKDKSTKQLIKDNKDKYAKIKSYVNNK